jgi:hypothetical protein
MSSQPIKEQELKYQQSEDVEIRSTLAERRSLKFSSIPAFSRSSSENRSSCYSKLNLKIRNLNDERYKSKSPFTLRIKLARSAQGSMLSEKCHPLPLLFLFHFLLRQSDKETLMHSPLPGCPH